MYRVVLDEKPEKNFRITVLPRGFQQVELFRNITEIEVDGKKKYEADYLKMLYPAVKKITEKDFGTQKQIDYIFDVIDEKKQKAAQKNRLMQQLNAIDAKSVRALRAISAKKGIINDAVKLQELEEQAEDVRAKIRELGA